MEGFVTKLAPCFWGLLLEQNSQKVPSGVSVATCALCSLSLYSPLLLPYPAAHPLGYSEIEPPISGGAKVLELEFKCGK